MLRRIHHVDPAGEDCNCAGFQRRAMRRMIDAARHAGNHHKTRAAQIGRDHPRKLDPQTRGIARPHQGDHLALEQRQIPQHRNHGRRRIERGKAGRKFRFNGGNDSSAQPVQPVHLGFRTGFVRNLQFARTAAPRQPGRRIACLTNIGKTRPQRRKCCRSDTVRARKPQPCDPFGRSERPAGHRPPILGSSPRRRRARFVRCE